MKPLRLSVALVAFGFLATAAKPAEAAWNNVFQVTCNCGPRASSSLYLAPAPVVAAAPPVVAYAAPAPCADPCQQCTTRYVQRCYYQPVTTYTTQSYYEPVTSYVTKTYYEPVTTYRYSCYYDPCSCGYQQVATPCTSYVARQQCCPVQSWVQRCAQVPVTAYQKSFYWEPQTTCCSTTVGAPVVAQPVPVAVAPAPVAVPAQPAPPPAVDGRQVPVPMQPAPPAVDGKQYDQYYMQPKDLQQSQFRQLQPNTQVPVKPAPVPPPSVKLERITAADGTRVQGQVVSTSNAPKAGVQLTFVSAQRQSPEKSVIANAAGQFSVNLPAGGWLVYIRMADGQQVYHSRIDVNAKQAAPFVLVSR